MKVRELINKAKNETLVNRTVEDIYWLLEDLYHLTKKDIILHYEDEIDDFVFFSLFDKLEEVPIQYLLNYGYFLGEKITVSKDVLIPRNETEELVINLKKIIINKKYKSILDIGTGSGVIAIFLERELLKEKYDINVDAIDISNNALKIAEINKKRFNSNCNFFISDVYENVNKKYDVIVSNPPYIAYDEFVEDRVKNNEPNLALYADEHGMRIYKKIIIDAHKYLNNHGLLAFEISPERKEEIEILVKTYLDIEKITFEKDINGFIRFCYIYIK